MPIFDNHSSPIITKKESHIQYLNLKEHSNYEIRAHLEIQQIHQ